MISKISVPVAQAANPTLQLERSCQIEIVIDQEEFDVFATGGEVDNVAIDNPDSLLPIGNVRKRDRSKLISADIVIYVDVVIEVCGNQAPAALFKVAVSGVIDTGTSFSTAIVKLPEAAPVTLSPSKSVATRIDEKSIEGNRCCRPPPCSD